MNTTSWVSPVQLLTVSKGDWIAIAVSGLWIDTMESSQDGQV